MGEILTVENGVWEDGAFVLRRDAGDAFTPDATCALTLRHSFDDVLFVPYLTPEEGQVIGDAVFRAPAVVLASGDRVVALVADVDDVARTKGYRAWLDVDHPKKTVTYAAGAFDVEGHVFYRRAALPGPPPAVSLRLHVVEGTSRDDAYGLAARWMWQRWGKPALEAPPPDLAIAMGHVVRWAFDSEWTESVWQDVELPTAHGATAGAPVFIVDVSRHPSVPPAERRWRERRSIWNQAWFSTQRCANGLLRYARQTEAPSLETRARAMTELAFAAPMTDGLFPAVLVADDPEAARGGTWRWTNSDRRPARASAEACHIVDAAFTCRMLLEWETLAADARVGPRVDAFVARLLDLQRPSGAFPGWVEPDGSVPAVLAEGPESAMAVSLLFERGHVAPARRGLAFLEGVAREGRWEDFETYFSCAPWGTPGAKVARNGVYKQNTLGIAWTAEAFFRGWRATGDARWLHLARRCLDELSLYQAVWSPPFLPAPGFGGFGVMNADSEWNDARQSLFAPLYLEIGLATGDAELVERGVAAMRASFAMLYAPENPVLAEAYERRHPFFGPESYGFMMENQGHGSAEPIGTFTIYTWGNGSALAAAATVRDRFPEVARACGL